MNTFDDWFKKTVYPSDSYDTMRFAWEAALAQHNSVQCPMCMDGRVQHWTSPPTCAENDGRRFLLCNECGWESGDGKTPKEVHNMNYSLCDLAKLSEEATPGNWVSDEGAREYCGPFSEEGASIYLSDDETTYIVIGGQQDEQGGAVGILRNEDAAFIVACVNYVRAELKAKS